MDFGAALERMTSSPQYNRGLMSLAGLDPEQQAAAQVNQAQIDEYNRAQQEREALKLIDPAMIPDQLRELWQTSPELAMKMWPQLVKEVAPASSLGKQIADVNAGIIPEEYRDAILKKGTTIPPVYDPVTKQLIYAGGEGGGMPDAPMTGGLEVPPEYANNPAAAQAYIEEKARSAAGQGKVDYEREQNVFDIEKNLRSEFKDRTKAFIDQRDAFGRIVNSAKDPSGAGDLSLIFNYMKVLDPGSTVREGEFAQVGKAGGLPGEIQNMFNRITGGERLTPEIRKDIVIRAGQLYQGAEEQTSILADEYTGLASQYGAKPERVVGKFGLPEKIKKDYNLLTGNTERQQALDAIAAGANPEEVKAFYKSRTGEDL